MHCIMSKLIKSYEMIALTCMHCLIKDCANTYNKCANNVQINLTELQQELRHLKSIGH